MTTINMTGREVAILKVQRKGLANRIAQLKNDVARAAFEAALTVLDEQLAAAPAKAEVQPVDRNLAAIRAHRSRLVKKLPGTRGKVRAELKARIAKYDEALAAPVVVVDETPKPKRVRKAKAPAVEQIEVAA